ncbi:MAG: hypothetical protein Kow0065_18420 [Methylomicrobium sp.]
MEKKRSGPKPVKPVEHDGVRYEAVHWGKARGLEQNGGYLAAFDQKSGEELWLLKVYDVNYDSDIEDDKQDVFITGLRFGWFNKSRLIIKNERNETFNVDLATRRVEKA